MKLTRRRFISRVIRMWRPKVIFFDLFGTVVDIRGRLRHELAHRPDAEQVITDWMAAYADVVNRGGEYRRLDHVLAECQPVVGMNLVCCWEDARPWPDALGMRADGRFGASRLAALTNACGDQVMAINRRHRLFHSWFSAGAFLRYKPDPKVYLGACKSMQIEPREALMVASHSYDLRAAQACGLRTALVRRLGEDEDSTGWFDFAVDDFHELASILRTA